MRKVTLMKTEQQRKQDVFNNSEDLSLVVEQYKNREKEKKKYMLRIDEKTVICVPAHKCNKEYAEAYRRRILNQK